MSRSGEKICIGLKFNLVHFNGPQTKFKIFEIPVFLTHPVLMSRYRSRSSPCCRCSRWGRGRRWSSCGRGQCRRAGQWCSQAWSQRHGYRVIKHHSLTCHGMSSPSTHTASSSSSNCPVDVDIISSHHYTARSAEVEPPGLGSKCGKRVERLRDFLKFPLYFPKSLNLSTRLPHLLKVR